MTLDEEIAAAQAQVARIRELAAGGDKIAALLVKKIDAAEAEVLATMMDRLFEGSP